MNNLIYKTMMLKIYTIVLFVESKDDLIHIFILLGRLSSLKLPPRTSDDDTVGNEVA